MATLAACGSRGPVYFDLDPRPWDAGGPRDAALDASTDAGVTPTDAATDAATDTGVPCPWEPVRDGLGGGGIAVIERDPRVAGVVWATTGERVYRSEDGGASWGVHAELPASVLAIAFPEPEMDLLLGTTDGVWASRDGGRSFEPLALRGLAVAELEAHPAARERVLASIYGLGILRSNDGGTSWSPASRGLEPATFVQRILGDPRDPDIALATSILTDPVTGGWTVEGQLLRTTDGGTTWVERDRTGGRPYELRRCASDPDVVLAVRRRGFFLSEDGGETFTSLDAIAPGVVLGADVGGPDCAHVVAFAGTPAETFGMYVSRDRGGRFDGPLREGFALSRATRSEPHVRVGEGDRVLVGTSSGLLLSDDGGRGYRIVSGLGALGVTSLEETSGNLWAGTLGGGLWVLARGSLRWHRIAPDVLDNDYAFSVLPMRGADADGGPVLVGLWGALVGRSAGEAAFTPIPNTGNPSDNVFDFAVLADGTILTASQTEGIQRSEDGGARFVDSSAGLSPWPTPVGLVPDFRAIAADLARPGLVVAGSNGRGIWRSTDDGRSWSPTALTDEAIVALHASRPHGRIYALLSGEGVAVSDDGAVWSRLDDGLASLDVTGLAEDPARGDLYLAAGGRVYVHEGPVDDADTWRPFGAACAPRDVRVVRVVARPDGRYLFASSAEGMSRHRLP
jgi:photosystem II stability/assembly factor-like uncharacterized protein